MRLLLLGLGSMGKAVATAAKQRGHVIHSVDPKQEEADFSELKEVNLADYDMALEFTLPSSVVANIDAITAGGLSIVVGATGWYEQMAEVKSIVKQRQVGAIWAGNFSIGVNLFYRLVQHAAAAINTLDMYDIAAIEYHHNKKADSPSGTAHAIGNILLQEISRKKEIVFDRIEERISPEQLHIASVRCGSIPGKHDVVFDSEADTITLSHSARNRMGFATGAVIAAEWLQGQSGFFGIEDLMKGVLASTK